MNLLGWTFSIHADAGAYHSVLKNATPPEIWIEDICDGVAVRVHPELRKVDLWCCGSLSPDTLNHCLHDLILPKLAARDGALVLHGGSVLIGSGCIAIVAPSGHGKSTLSASLHAEGFPLISDDAIILRPEESRYQGVRLHPTLRLFPDSLSRLFPGAVDTTLVADYTDKRRLSVAAGPDTAPLRALFRLCAPTEDIRIIRLAPAAACMAMIENAFALDPADARETRGRFELAAKAARVVPVFDLAYPRDYDRLPDVHSALFDALSACA